MRWQWLLCSLFFAACDQLEESAIRDLLNESENSAQLQQASDRLANRSEREVLKFEHLRDPFHWADISSGQVASVKTRKRDLLESFPLEQLLLVGVLANAEHSWALIKADRTVYPVRAGQYIGVHEGRIANIFQDHIEIHEATSSGAEPVRQSLVMHSSK